MYLPGENSSVFLSYTGADPGGGGGGGGSRGGGGSNHLYEPWFSGPKLSIAKFSPIFGPETVD